MTKADRAMRVAAVVAVLGASLLAFAEQPPEVPEAIRTRAGEQLVLKAHAAGVQIYVCARGPDGKPQWTFKAPAAELRDPAGVVIGHHAAGPSWRHRDGSAVTGKATAHSDSPDSSSIPWLLLSATGHTGKGVLAHVTSVQRINTLGGQAPAVSTCNPAKQQGKEARVPYRADYLFYAADSSTR